jgi:hypothetical protein
VDLVVDIMRTKSYIIECEEMVENFCPSGTCTSTLNYILIDRSHRDLLDDGKISGEKSG